MQQVKSDSGSQKSVTAMLAIENEDYFDQIEELTHKLFLAENQIAALQQGNHAVSDVLVQ